MSIQYVNFAVAGLAAAGVPPAVIGAAIKDTARAKIGSVADSYRAKISTVAPAKIAEWLFKEQIARAPASARPEELAILDREAAARGVERDELLAQIRVKANSFREIALLVGAIEAETKATIAALDESAETIEADVIAALLAAQAEAEAAYAEALAVINKPASGN